MASRATAWHRLAERGTSQSWPQGEHAAIWRLLALDGGEGADASLALEPQHALVEPAARTMAGRDA